MRFTYKEHIAKIKVSYFYQLRYSGSTSTIEAILRSIKSDTLEEKITHLRLLEGDKYTEMKRKLPVVTFSGLFSNSRNLSQLDDYTHVLVLDIDKVESDELMVEYGRILKKDDYVIAYWISPSGRGYKALVYLEDCRTVMDVEKEVDVSLWSSLKSDFHKCGFAKAVDYFKRKYDIELDKSGSDIPRACFMTYDPNLVVKKEFDSFEIKDIDFAKYLELDVDAVKAIWAYYSENASVWKMGGAGVGRSRSKGKNRVFKSRGRTVEHNGRNIEAAFFNPVGKNHWADRRIMEQIIAYLRREKYSITENYVDWRDVALVIANTFSYDVGERYFIQLSRMDEDKFDENDCVYILQCCYRDLKPIGRTMGVIIKKAKDCGFRYKTVKM